MYQLIIKPKAKKKFIKLQVKDKEKVLVILDKLKQNPYNLVLGYIKLAGTKRSYRIRIGKIRIIYELFKEEKIINVRLIDYRKTGTYKSSWIKI